MNFHPTRNNLPSKTKTIICSLLNARVADAIDLALMTKQAHWNLRGPTFIAAHEMLDVLRSDIDGHIDTLAERVVQLGGIALGSSQVVAKSSELGPYPDDLVRVEGHLAALAERYGQLANSTRAAIATTEEAADADTADILTVFSRFLDKALWFLEAHEGPRA
jgi:starvation-inducible DNA-binding protein